MIALLIASFLRVFEFLKLLNGLLVIVLIVLTIYHFYFQSLPSTKLGNKIQGLASLPILGNAYEVLSKSPTELVKFVLQVGRGAVDQKIARFWFGSKLAVILFDPRDIEIILSSNTHLEKSSEYDLFRPWLGDGLLISKGDKWRLHRKIIAPTFHQSILKTFMPTFNENARDLVEKLKRKCDGSVIDVHDYMTATTVDVLLETVMGVKGASQEKSSFDYAKAVMRLCYILHLRHYKVLLRPEFIFRFTKWAKIQKKMLDIIHSLADKVVKIKQSSYVESVKSGDSLYAKAVKATEDDSNQPESNQIITFNVKDDLDINDEDIGEKKRLAFLDFMIEASHSKDVNLSDKDIIDEVNTIMFEGHDTTAAATSFFLCILGAFPEIQDKVFQEVCETLQNSDRDITFNDITEMKYLERVILETLRIFPPVPVILRILREDVKLFSGDYIVPKGATIAIATLLLHRDIDLWPNPTKFDPDRFLPENCQGRHYYSFIPFSAGPRSCVGRKYAMLKMKTLLATVVKNFKIKSEITDIAKIELQGDIILKMADGFKITLEQRQKL